MFGLPPVDGKAIRPAQCGVNNWLGVRPIAPGPHNFRWTVPVGPEKKAAKTTYIHTGLNLPVKETFTYIFIYKLKGIESLFKNSVGSSLLSQVLKRHHNTSLHAALI